MDLNRGKWSHQSVVVWLWVTSGKRNWHFPFNPQSFIGKSPSVVCSDCQRPNLCLPSISAPQIIAGKSLFARNSVCLCNNLTQHLGDSWVCLRTWSQLKRTTNEIEQVLLCCWKPINRNRGLCPRILGCRSRHCYNVGSCICNCPCSAFTNLSDFNWAPHRFCSTGSTLNPTSNFFVYRITLRTLVWLINHHTRLIVATQPFPLLNYF